MKVLVTGGAGFIGSHTVDLLLEHGHEVTVLDNLDPQVHGEAAEPANLAHVLDEPALRFIRGDVRDGATVEEALDGVESVIHLAAAVGVGQSMYRPFYYADVNVAGQARLMEVMARAPERYRSFVVASSMSIYGEGAYRCDEHGTVFPRPRPEDQLAEREWEVRCPECGRAAAPVATAEAKPTQHSSIYAVTKKTQEEMALSLGAAYGIPTVALRFFNVYGSRQALSNPYTGVAAIFMSRLKNDQPPVIFEDGHQSRDFVHVSDVAESVRLAMGADAAAAGVYNVCTGRSRSILDVATALADRLGVDLEPKVEGRYRAGDIRHCFGDPSRAAAGLGFEARVAFEHGLDELLDWADEAEARDDMEMSMAELEKHRLVR